uniref:28S ribosomal protein S18b, mitochondrial n=1 Tax=Rhabditophanes sp. KR3021 TaxID=114890 RepID=A0AC35TW16_9BILA
MLSIARLTKSLVKSNLPQIKYSHRLCSSDTKTENTVAHNHIERKKGLFKPFHSITDQVNYMASEVYEETYKGLPVFKWYKRNIRGQEVTQSKPRLFCIDKEGKFNVNHACPICRDEYLYFDYRNPTLIEQFLAAGTDQVIHILKTGLCREQYNQLQAQLIKAKEHGTITFTIDFRSFDYKQWYPTRDVTHITKHKIPANLNDASMADIHPQPLVDFPAHKRDYGTNWDQWWIRHDEFKKSK